MIFGAQTPTQHLTYCTNVHPGEHATDVANVLSEHVPAVRDALGHKGPFGVGLRISDMASRELSQPEGIEHLRGLLDQHELYVFTLNGFPYGTFHRAPVKDLVHRPDWTEPARLDYLARLAHLLSKLDLPDNEGSISTSPLGYRKHHPDAKSAIEASALALATLCNELHTLEAETGQWIHVDLEPEPDGLLEQLDETAEFFVEVLLRAGRDHLGRIAGISSNQAEAWLRRYLGVCLDVCHAAVRFESVDEGLERLAAEDIAIGKIQLSSAIEAHWSSADEATAVVEALRFFDEPVYVHQAVRRGHDGSVDRFEDLAPALDAIVERGPGMLRTHFHVPLFLETYGLLLSTQSAVAAVLDRQRTAPVTRHLEVETYTWGVLPQPMQTDQSSAIARELKWVLEQA